MHKNFTTHNAGRVLDHHGDHGQIDGPHGNRDRDLHGCTAHPASFHQNIACKQEHRPSNNIYAHKYKDVIYLDIVLDKAETTGSLLISVQSHDDSLDLAALGEERVNLFLGCVEGKIADIQSTRLFNAANKGICPTLINMSQCGRLA